jgi:Pentapeptide repeats (8 copies)
MSQNKSVFDPLLILNIILPIVIIIVLVQLINNHLIGRDVQYFWCQIQEIYDPSCQLNNYKPLNTNTFEQMKYLLSVKKDISIARSTNYSIWIQSMGSAVLGVTAYAAWQNFKVAEEKQVADKFSKAIDQLGSHGDDKIYIRLGGIYTLEQIAHNSKEYHWTIMEILSDFIREKRPIKYQLDSNGEPVNLDDSSNSKVPIDVCAAFTALGRRNVGQDQGKKINLHRVDLAGMILSDTQDFDLSNINFAHSNMSFNHFAKTNFTGANLNGCYLKHTSFCGANMSKAGLGANFNKTMLIETDFSNSVFFGATFHEADVHSAIFKGAVLSNKNFPRGCDFSQAYNVEHAIFDENTETEGAAFPENFQFMKMKS